MRRDLDPDER